MKKIVILVLAFILVITTFYTQPHTYAQSQNRTVQAETLNLRSGPGLSYDVTASLKKGEPLEVLSASGDWLQVKYKDRTGWVAAWLTNSESSQKNASQTKKVVSQVNGLNIRSAASIGSSVIGKMSAGEEAIQTARVENWVQINLNGLIGWVYADYISTVDRSKQQETSQVSTSATSDTFTVAVDTLNVRKSNNLSSKKVKLIFKNESYPVKEIKDNWVRIAFDHNHEGWVYSFHGELSSSKNQQDNKTSNTQSVTVLTDGTNIRSAASTSSQVVMRANAGEQFKVNNEVNDWYEVTLPNGNKAFVAKWVVSTGSVNQISTPTNKQPRVPGTLQGISIVIDAGHGGNDGGTIGARRTLEKNLTLKTSELLANKLKAAGASVHLTRESDDYISLQRRVAISHQQGADAFISIHYDASLDSSITGFTTYYTHQRQAKLAQAVNNGLNSTLSIRNRGAQPGNYYVLRENKQNAILIELGFLSNPLEEHTVNSANFREQATHGIYNGLLNYFNQ